jgi:type IV pilus assembly protein PilX
MRTTIPTMQPAAASLARPRRQRGAILVTSLLMLLVLTVIGVSVMQITRMQERMAGNTRDLNLAFQGAEAGLRDAEQMLWVTPNIVACNGPDCVYPRGILPVLNNQDQDWWDDNSQEYGEDGDREVEELDEDPQFVAEELAFVGPLVVDDPGGRMFYQVTARSTGASGSANTVLQTTYAKPE